MEKPDWDFLINASEKYKATVTSDDIFYPKNDADYVWDTYVELLKKDNEEMKAALKHYENLFNIR